mgnify:CR=1 FL=1
MNRLIWGKKFAIFILICSIIFLLSIPQINQGSGYDNVGPRFFPWVITTGLLLVSIFILFKRSTVPSIAINLYRLLTLLLGVTLIFLCLEPLGFILTMALLFSFISYQIHKGNLFKRLGIGFIFSLAIYLLFTLVLDLNLPRGALYFL